MIKQTVETDKRGGGEHNACIGLGDTRDPELTAASSGSGAAPQECVLRDFCECDGRRPINLRLNRGRKGKDTKDSKGKDEQKTPKLFPFGPTIHMVMLKSHM